MSLDRTSDTKANSYNTRGAGLRKNSASDKQIAKGDKNPQGNSTGDTSKRGSKMPVHCAECKTGVKEKDKGVCCELCGTWHHAICAGLDDTLYESMQKESNGRDGSGLHWFCRKPRPCNDVASKYLMNMMKLESKVEMISAKVDSLSDKMNNLEQGNLPPAMTEAVKKICQPLTSNLEAIEPGAITQMEDIAASKAKKEVAEMEDRNKRKTNVVIFKLDEDASDKKKEKDEEQVRKILGEIHCTRQPTDIRRLGSAPRNKEGEPPKRRPLRLSFATEKERDEVLKAFRNAQRTAPENDEESLTSKISMRKDLTPQEREESTRLFLELKQRQEQSKNDKDQFAVWRIRRGQVVNEGKYPKADTYGDPPIRNEEA
jgi:hypothetical protein